MRNWLTLLIFVPMISFGAERNLSYVPEVVSEYKAKAETGEIAAQYLYACAQLEGWGTVKDKRAAFGAFQRLATHGYGLSYYYMGHGYAEGWGGSTNVAESVKWFGEFVKWARPEAERGSAEAQSNLGSCFWNGNGVETNRTEAVNLWRKAAEQGHVRALFKCGFCYWNGIGVESNLVKAVKLWQKAAEQGHAPAQGELGWCYEHGVGLEKNLAEAVRWYCKAATQGDAEAQCRLGRCYWNGIGVNSNIVDAVTWWQKAAEQGHVRAQQGLGWCYKYGVGLEKNLTEAFFWYRKAAEQGNCHAQFDLGCCYWEGIGVNSNIVDAVKLWQKAAEQGYVCAQYCLGVCYEYGGTGFEKNLTEAFLWYQKAAAQGCAEAQFKLGECFEKGLGVRMNLERAFEWYRMAAEQGYAKAQIPAKRLSTFFAGNRKFNGVVFGANINDECQSVEEVDMSIDRGGLGSNRGLVGESGTHQLSYLSARYVPEKAFRRFKSGFVYASWTSHLVYEVCYAIQFDREQTVAADFAEYQETLNALKRKYGEGRVDEDSDGDRTAEFRDGHIVILLEYTKEGYLDRGALRLSAWHEKLRDLANKESLAYYQKRMKEETSAVKAGGEDAL